MKKLFALMLALMLALAGISFAGAEETAEAPVVEAAAVPASGSITLKLDLNGDIIAAMTGAADEAAAKTVSTIVELINNLTITMTSDGVDAEMIVSVKDEPVTGLAVLKDENCLFLISDLFPKHILKIDQSAAGTGMGMPQISLDPEQAASMLAPITALITELQSRIGEPEAVEDSFYDTAFTAKMPINMTTKELLQLVLGAVKEMVSQEGFTSLMDQLKASGMPINFDAAEIDNKLEEINNAKDEELPVLDASLYANESGDGIFVINLVKGEEVINITTGSLAGGFVTEVTVPNTTHVFMKGSQVDGTLTMNIEATPQEGLALNINADFAAGEEGFKGQIEVIMNNVKLGTIFIEGTPNGVLTGQFGLEGKTEISLTDLQNQSGEASQAFSTDIQMGLMTVMTKLIKANPELATLMQQMMPQTQQK